MARVTVEDCIDKIPNRFELILTAGQRARQIAAGADLTIDRDRDKNAVVALREIAGETVSLGALGEALVQTHQRVLDTEDHVPEPQSLSLSASAAALRLTAAQPPRATSDDSDDE